METPDTFKAPNTKSLVLVRLLYEENGEEHGKMLLQWIFVKANGEKYGKCSYESKEKEGTKKLISFFKDFINEEE